MSPIYEHILNGINGIFYTLCIISVFRVKRDLPVYFKAYLVALFGLFALNHLVTIIHQLFYWFSYEFVDYIQILLPLMLQIIKFGNNFLDTTSKARDKIFNTGRLNRIYAYFTRNSYIF